MFLPVVGKDKRSPNTEIRFRLVHCTVLTKSVSPIGTKKLVKKCFATSAEPFMSGRYRFEY
jgi:hypothetical protein